MPSLTRPLASLLLLLTVLGAGCGGSRKAGEEPRPRTNTSMLTSDEIRGGQWASAYELIESLRPRWLSSRGPDLLDGTVVEVQVYLDGSRMGGPSNLRAINVSDITYIQFYDGVTAAGRWGPDHHNGVIWISTKPR